MLITNKNETALVARNIVITSTELIVLRDMVIELDQHYANLNANDKHKSVRLSYDQIKYGSIALINAMSFMHKLTEGVQGIADAKEELFESLGVQPEPTDETEPDMSYPE